MSDFKCTAEAGKALYFSTELSAAERQHKMIAIILCLQDEKQRIEALGGCVIWFGTWRVNGSLSVSRAIGKLFMNVLFTAHFSYIFVAS